MSAPLPGVYVKNGDHENEKIAVHFLSIIRKYPEDILPLARACESVANRLLDLEGILSHYKDRGYESERAYKQHSLAMAWIKEIGTEKGLALAVWSIDRGLSSNGGLNESFFNCSVCAESVTLNTANYTLMYIIEIVAAHLRAGHLQEVLSLLNKYQADFEVKS
jgi:hypothetical protein